jgi:hypothetical protein
MVIIEPNKKKRKDPKPHVKEKKEISRNFWLGSALYILDEGSPQHADSANQPMPGSRTVSLQTADHFLDNPATIGPEVAGY